MNNFEKNITKEKKKKAKRNTKLKKIIGLYMND